MKTDSQIKQNKANGFQALFFVGIALVFSTSGVLAEEVITKVEVAAPQSQSEQAAAAAAAEKSESPADKKAARAFHAAHARKMKRRHAKVAAATEKTETKTQNETGNQAPVDQKNGEQ